MSFQNPLKLLRKTLKNNKFNIHQPVLLASGICLLFIGILVAVSQLIPSLHTNPIRNVLNNVLPSFVLENAPDNLDTSAVTASSFRSTSARSQLFTGDKDVIETIDIITKDNINSALDWEFAISQLYSIDASAYVFEEDLALIQLSNYDLSLNLTGSDPKILIFHTHSQEAFIDSRPNVESDTIIGVGETLAKLLKNDYNISTLHYKGSFDVVDGVEARGGSYERMEPVIRDILALNPSIDVIIDLHRDALPSNKRLATRLYGEPTAKIMFFNGICRLNEADEPVELDYLENPYLQENLAFSLQMKLEANARFPDLTRKNYIKPYRYSLHMAPRSLLVEVGSNTNTVQEAKNAMQPLAELLFAVLSE